MKKIFLSVVLAISMVTTINQQDFLGKVFTKVLNNNIYLIGYCKNLPIETVISTLPDDIMTQRMTDLYDRCQSADILNKISLKDLKNMILLHIMEKMFVVPKGRLIDYDKVLIRYNSLRP